MKNKKQNKEQPIFRRSSVSQSTTYIPLDLQIITEEDLQALNREDAIERKKINNLIKDGKTELAIEAIEKSYFSKREKADLKALATAEVAELAKTKETEEGLYQQAIQLVLKTRNARNTFLRHKLKISQPKTTAIIERMTEEGILGQYKGSNIPREILK